jgi:hypothetical protein
MAKILKKDRIKYILIMLFLSIFFTLILSGKKEIDEDMVAVFITSHFITLIINNFYIYYIFTKTKKLKSIYDKIVVRIGRKNFFIKYFLNILLDVIIYLLIILIPLYIKFGFISTNINLFILFLVINISLFIIYELISISIIILPKGNKYIIIPVILNIIYHYILMPLIINGTVV